MTYDDLVNKTERLDARVQSLATELAATKRRLKEMELKVALLLLQDRKDLRLPEGERDEQ